MDLILGMMLLFALPWLVFVIPMVYADKVCKGKFEDFSLYPEDYKE